MNEDLHNEEPVIPAKKGWQEMQQLLDKHLPEKRRVFNPWIVSPYVAAVILSMALFFNSFHLKNKAFAPPRADKSVAITSNTFIKPVTKTSANGNEHTFYLTNNKNATTKKNALSSIQPEQPAIWNHEPELTTGEAGINNPMSETHSFIPEMSIQHSEPQNIITVISGRRDENAFIQKKINQKIAGTSSWSLSVGIGINKTLQAVNDFQPYPVAEIKYNMSPKIFVAAGLSAWSPVSNTTGGLSKSTFLNDTINNIEYYNETTTYKRLRYIDIPLSLGVNITKNFSIQGGAQISVLAGKKTEKVQTPYDYQRNSVTAPSNVNVFVSPANPQQQFDVAARNLDLRLHTSIRYSYKNVGIGITYQHALQSVGKGSATGDNRNHLVGLNVFYRIK